MGWRDLLDTGDERVILPWLGGKYLRSFDRRWWISGPTPPEHGWWQWQIKGRLASFTFVEVEPQPTLMIDQTVGYLVGDHVVPDDATSHISLAQLAETYERVHLLDPGIDRFARVRAGRVAEGCPLLFIGQEFPLGPEEEVLDAYLDNKPDTAHIKEVTPALHMAFRMECFHRAVVEKRRKELEERRAQEEAEREREERREHLRATVGDAALRRELALVDFPAAATAALAVGGAEFLDHRTGTRPGEWIVKYRLSARRFECVCDTRMRIIDSGICLTDESTGEKGDTLFTLESLPPVVQHAIDEDILVVYRHG
jgi:hypothetical protein